MTTRQPVDPHARIADIMVLEKETEGLLHEIVDDLQGVKA